MNFLEYFFLFFRPYLCKIIFSLIDYTTEAHECGLLGEVRDAVECLSVHADSLLEGFKNNLCKQFNSIVSKFISGKRVFHGRRDGYITRVEAAVLSWNSGEYVRVIHKACGDNVSPGKVQVTRISLPVLLSRPVASPKGQRGGGISNRGSN